MVVGEVEKHRWNGCGAQQEMGRVEGSFVGTCWDGRDRTGQGRDGDEGESQIKMQRSRDKLWAGEQQQ